MTYNYSELDADTLEYVPIAETAEIPSGERIFIEIDEHRIVVINIDEKLYAIADVCSHDDGPLGDGELGSNYEIKCPRHGALFDVRTGIAKTLPAVVDIPVYPIRVVDDRVEIGIPKVTE